MSTVKKCKLSTLGKLLVWSPKEKDWKQRAASKDLDLSNTGKIIHRVPNTTEKNKYTYNYAEKGNAIQKLFGERKNWSPFVIQVKKMISSTTFDCRCVKGTNDTKISYEVYKKSINNIPLEMKHQNEDSKFWRKQVILNTMIVKTWRQNEIDFKKKKF